MNKRQRKKRYRGTFRFKVENGILYMANKGKRSIYMDIKLLRTLEKLLKKKDENDESKSIVPKGFGDAVRAGYEAFCKGEKI